MCGPGNPAFSSWRTHAACITTLHPGPEQRTGWARRSVYPHQHGSFPSVLFAMKVVQVSSAPRSLLASAGDSMVLYLVTNACTKVAHFNDAGSALQTLASRVHSDDTSDCATTMSKERPQQGRSVTEHDGNSSRGSCKSSSQVPVAATSEAWARTEPSRREMWRRTKGCAGGCR